MYIYVHKCICMYTYICIYICIGNESWHQLRHMPYLYPMVQPMPKIPERLIENNIMSMVALQNDLDSSLVRGCVCLYWMRIVYYIYEFCHYHITRITKFSRIIQMAVLLRYISHKILQYVLIMVLNKHT
jgi:hypothetical protein